MESGMGRNSDKKGKKVTFNNPLNMAVGLINYAFSAGPVFAAALKAQGNAGSGDSRYALLAATVALLGEAAKSFTITNVKGDGNPQDIQAMFVEQSKEALDQAWDSVKEKWSEEFSAIPNDDLVELKKDSYGAIFRFDEESGTAYIDQSSMSADKIQEKIVLLLQNRLNQNGDWQDDDLKEIAAAVTMTFFAELGERIRYHPDLYCQLDIGEVKKRLDAVEEKLDGSFFDADRIQILQEDVDKLKELYHKYKKKIVEFLEFHLAEIEQTTKTTLQNTEELKATGTDTNAKVTEIHDYLFGNNADTSAITTAFSDLIRSNPIRHLAENLWVNWNTGVLASDFCSALGDGDSDKSGQDHTAGYICELTAPQMRLLSILVQGEGAVISWEELDLRMRTMFPPKEKTKDGFRGTAVDRPKSLFMDMGDESWYAYSEDRIKTSIRKLRSVSAKLAALIDDPDSSDYGCGIALYVQPEDADTGKLCEENTYDIGSQDKANDPYVDDTCDENAIHDEDDSHDGCEDEYENGYRIDDEYAVEGGYDGYGYGDEYEEASESDEQDLNGSDDKDHGQAKEYYRLYSEYCRYFFEYAKETDRSQGTREEINADTNSNEGYEAGGIVSKRDLKILREASNDNDRDKDVYRQAWFRWYYGQSCYDFETDTINVGNRTDAVKDMFGDYKMAQIYQNAYAAISTSGKQNAGKQKERWTEWPHQYYHARTAVMLDYVESWFKQVNGKDSARYGKVLVLHGQPGDGKTTFCKKAVYAHCKEGWLSGGKSGATHVVRFDLNPSASNNEIHSGASGILALDKGLCFKESKGLSSTFKITPGALTHSLVIFDGYDELSSELSSDNEANTFSLFCGRVLSLATEYKFNAIITSRTMCIKDELAGDAIVKRSEVKSAFFAPTTVSQQQAMVSRMITLSPDTTKGELRGYSKEWLPELRKNENLDELMRIPSLFRMIVTLRFKEYNTDTLAELYKKLVDTLFDYKNIKDDDKKVLIRSYERIAARIFLYNDDTCPFSGNADNKNRELLYRFLTKNDDNMRGHIGFLHRSFYQYFLARFIISSIKNSMASYDDSRYSMSTYFPHEEEQGGDLREPELSEPDLIDLVTILRERPITDLDMWKLVVQVATIEREESKDNSKALKQEHIIRALDWLENEENEARLMSEFHGIANKCYHPNGIKKGFRALENVVYNLIGSIAAAEQGRCQGMDWKEFERQSIRFGAIGGRHGYPNICRLLRSGSFKEIYLAYLNFVGCDLSNARMQRAVFTDMFSDSNRMSKERTSLAGKGANLSEADLSGADLAGAFLTRVRLTGAKLYGTNLHGATLLDANLDNINLVDSTDLAKNKTGEKNPDNKDVERDTHTDLSGAGLTNASFVKANLRGADLSKAWLREACLQQASLEDANLSNAALTGAQFESTNLEGANLSGAEVSGVDLAKGLWLPKMRYSGVLTVCEKGKDRKVDLLKENEGIPFGHYPQRKNDVMDKAQSYLWKPLYWRVLRREYDKVLLITEDLIDCQPYNDTYVDVTWEKSFLRRWMNEVFILNAFTEEERARIAWVCNQNPDNDYNVDAVEGGNPTWDRVFALSIDEAWRYFKGEVDRQAPVTPYAKKDGSYIYGYYKIRQRGTGWWWLRSPGILSINAALVYTDGDVFEDGYSVGSSSVSVRPALWLHL